jgi:hypothetical protein
MVKRSSAASLAAAATPISARAAFGVAPVRDPCQICLDGGPNSQAAREWRCRRVHGSSACERSLTGSPDKASEPEATMAVHPRHETVVLGHRHLMQWDKLIRNNKTFMQFGTTKDSWRKIKRRGRDFCTRTEVVGSKVRHRADGIYVWCHDVPSPGGIFDGDRPMRRLTEISASISSLRSNGDYDFGKSNNPGYPLVQFTSGSVVRSARLLRRQGRRHFDSDRLRGDRKHLPTGPMPVSISFRDPT